MAVEGAALLTAIWTVSLCFQLKRLCLFLLAVPGLSQVGNCEQRHSPDSQQDDREFKGIERASRVRWDIDEVPEEQQGQMENAHQWQLALRAVVNPSHQKRACNRSDQEPQEGNGDSWLCKHAPTSDVTRNMPESPKDADE